MPKGLNYTHLKWDGSLSIHILQVDPQYARIQSVHAGTEILCLEKTSSIASRYGAFAAINGGFFRRVGTYSGASSGSLMIDHHWLSSPLNDRAAIGWKEEGKTVLIDRLSLKSQMACNGYACPIDAINQPRTLYQTVLYTSQLGESTLTDSPGVEIPVDQNFVLLNFENSGDTKIPDKGFVYSIAPSAILDFPESLIGSKISFSFLPLPLVEPHNGKLWESMQYIVGGTPLLISQGKIVQDFTVEKVLTSFLEKKHGRTAVGILPNGNWLFVVVDGRQPFFSLGMTMKELAEFMHSLGCVYALNLDGGGSSTFYLDGKVRNSPSGDEEEGPIPLRGERMVSDAILIHLKTH